MIRLYIEMADAPMQRGGIVFIMRLSADGDQRITLERAPNRGERVIHVARAVPSRAKPAHEIVALLPRGFRQSWEVRRQRPEAAQFKAHGMDLTRPSR